MENNRSDIPPRFHRMAEHAYHRRRGKTGIVAALFAALGVGIGVALDRAWPTGESISTEIDVPAGVDVQVIDASATAPGSAENAGNGLGVSRSRLQSALASPTEPRFRYRDVAVSDGPPLVAGRLGDGLALLELIGPAENLTYVRLVLPLVARPPVGPPRTDQAPPPPAEIVVPEATYMVLLAREIAPQWHGASAWIEEFLPQAVGGSTATTTQGQVQFTLARIERFGLVVLTAAPR